MRKIFLTIVWIILTNSLAVAGTGAIVTQNKFATQAGKEILEKGGNAAEAAIAAAFMLGVAEPHNSGIGGGGFLLYYDKAQNTFTFVDYREAAPLDTKIEDFKKPEVALIGGRAVAVPGLVAGLHKIYERFGGSVSWADLLSAAIAQARNGYIPGALMRARYEQEKNRLAEMKDFATVFAPALQAKKDLLKQENLALTLEKIASGGFKEFYRGALAKEMVRELNDAGSTITLEDLSRYQVYFSPPKKFIVKDFVIYSAALPSTGGLLLEQLLSTAQAQGIKSDTPAFADFLEKQLAQYFEKRRELGDARSDPFASTSHLCVIDGQGNIAAMTNTLNTPFGSGVLLPGLGILMNNEMDDFDFENPEGSKNLPNRGNRPLSSMSPTIVFRGLDPLLVIGSPGGLTIPINLYQVLQRHLLEGENLASAIKSPKIYFIAPAHKAFTEAGFKALLPDGLKIRPTLSDKPVGNVQAIRIEKGKFTTFSDPRGEGVGEVIKVP